MTIEPVPSLDTPLLELPALVLDLETTGLDVRKARVVQVGALAMEGAALLHGGARLDSTVRPDIPIPATATRVHGLGDAEVATAPPFAELAATLLAWLRGRAAIGHHVGYDLAVLRFEAARAGLPWNEPPALDIALLAGALDPTLRVPSFERVASRLGVAMEGRHSAMGDCLTAARTWTRLAALLHGAGVRTLGEARAFAARRDDLLLRQAEEGWYDTPAFRHGKRRVGLRQRLHALSERMRRRRITVG